MLIKKLKKRNKLMYFKKTLSQCPKEALTHYIQIAY